MALVMNASSQEQSVRVHGSWFTFTPGQIKDMHEDKVYFLSSNCAYLGFVSLPETLADLEFRSSEEGKTIIQKAKETGIANRIQHLEELKRNELVSLQRDIDKSNMKYDARLEMASGMVKNLEELAGYKSRSQDAKQQQLDRVKEIEKLLGE